MEDLTAAQLAKLELAANEAAVMRGFVQHPGYKLLVREIEKKIADKKNEWLNAKTSDEAEAIRLGNKAWGEILHFATALIIKGDLANRALPQKQESE
jgi:hypothetical protein